jgi:hypothetical protein
MYIKDCSYYDSDHDWSSILELSEQFNQSQQQAHPRPLKARAADLLRRKTSNRKLTRTELRALLCKAKKMKKSSKKHERFRGVLLEKEIQKVFNC